MRRREFLRTGAALGAASLAGLRPLAGGERPDLVLRGATLFDGTGAPGREADVAVLGDRIVEVGRRLARGREELDLRGYALAPGFIDIHSHADLSLLVNPRAESRIRQGVTLEVVGQDGSSVGPWSESVYREVRARYRERYGVEIDFRDLAGFFRALERTPPAVNVASMVGHGTIRSRVLGEVDRKPSAEELARMRALVQEGCAGPSPRTSATAGAGWG